MNVSKSMNISVVCVVGVVVNGSSILSFLFQNQSPPSPVLKSLRLDKFLYVDL